MFTNSIGIEIEILGSFELKRIEKAFLAFFPGDLFYKKASLFECTFIAQPSPTLDLGSPNFHLDLSGN